MGTCQTSLASRSKERKQAQLDVTKRNGLGKVAPSSAVGSVNQSNPEVGRETSHPIFKAIEDNQTESGVPFGHLLDAGTGIGSLQWIAHLTSTGNRGNLGVSGWNAITTSETMFQLCTAEGKRLGISTKDNLILGNWFGKDNGEHDEAPESIVFPHGDMFDTILVDYLIGAMDAFSPFRQDCIFDRLAKHLKPGGRMYLLGMQPIPERKNGVADLVCKVKRIRDSCILLAGERCYREHPISWVERNMRRSGLHILHSSKFPLLHREEDLMDQVSTARWMLKHMDDRNLASSFEDSLFNLEREIRTSLRGQTIKLGFDYFIIAEKSLAQSNTSAAQ